RVIAKSRNRPRNYAASVLLALAPGRRHGIPEPDAAVGAGDGGATAVGRECQGLGRRTLLDDRSHTAALPELPELHTAVLRGRSDYVAGRREGERPDAALVIGVQAIEAARGRG